VYSSGGNACVQCEGVDVSGLVVGAAGRQLSAAAGQLKKGRPSRNNSRPTRKKAQTRLPKTTEPTEENKRKPRYPSEPNIYYISHAFSSNFSESYARPSESKLSQLVPFKESSSKIEGHDGSASLGWRRRGAADKPTGQGEAKKAIQAHFVRCLACRHVLWPLAHCAKPTALVAIESALCSALWAHAPSTACPSAQNYTHTPLSNHGQCCGGLSCTLNGLAAGSSLSGRCAQPHEIRGHPLVGPSDTPLCLSGQRRTRGKGDCA
jgi:hypothetical protein